MTVLVVRYFTYLKHTALDRLQVRLNVILLLSESPAETDILYCIIASYKCADANLSIIIVIYMSVLSLISVMSVTVNDWPASTML